MRMTGFRRFTILVLAGASTLALNANTQAAPLDPAGLSPTVLFPVSDTGTAALFGLEARYAKPTFTNLQMPVGFADPPDTDQKSMLSSNGQTGDDRYGLFLSTSDNIGPSSVTVHRSRLALRPTLDGTFDRLSQGIRFGLPPSDAFNSGVDADLFDGRVQISSDMTVASDPLKPLGLRPGEDLNSVGEIDTAFHHSFAAKVVDHDHFKWSLAGQMGQIDPRFADFIFTAPGDKGPALQWSALSTRVDFGAASLSVGFNDVTREDQVERNRSLTLGFNRSALSVYRRDASQFSLEQGGHWLRRTGVTGVSADVIVADVLPSKLAEVLSPVTPFLPNMVSVNFEQGDTLQPDGPSTSTPIERVRSMAADLTWDTRFGQTTASVWERDIRADVGDVRLETSTDRVIDLSHSVTRGNWRFGAGVAFIESGDDTPTSHSREKRIAPHISFAYSSEDFPTIEVRLGAADARTVVGVDDIPASAKARQLQVSLDLSNFVQEQLNKPQARLKLEYRRDLESSDNHLGGRFAHEGDQALLLTFSTPLN